MSNLRILKRKAVDSEHDYVEASGEGTATADLPTGEKYANGSWYMDIVTKQVLFWRESTKTWQ